MIRLRIGLDVARPKVEEHFLMGAVASRFRPTEVGRGTHYRTYAFGVCTSHKDELRNILVTDDPAMFVCQDALQKVYYVTADVFAPLLEVDDALCRKLTKLSLEELRWVALHQSVPTNMKGPMTIQGPAAGVRSKDRSWAKQQVKGGNRCMSHFCVMGTTKAVSGSTVDYDIVDSWYTLVLFKYALEKAGGVVALDAETEQLDPYSGTICLTISTEDGKAWYIPDTWISSVLALLDWSKVVGQNLPYDLQAADTFPLQVGGDSHQIAAFLEVPLGKRGLKAQVREEFGFHMVDFDEVAVDGSLAQASHMARKYYACSDADWTRRLVGKLMRRLKKERPDSMPAYALQLKMIPIAAEMEKNGVKIDVQRLETLGALQEQQIKALVKSMEVVTGKVFNPASTAEVAEALFGEDGEGEEARVFTTTGKPSTAVAVLEGMDNATAELMREWREVTKLKSTYTDTLPLRIHARDGRVHPTVNMATVVSGRWSMSKPNFQQIPRTPTYRGCVIAENGWTLVKADYNQLELRVLAGLIGRGTMFDILSRDGDLHAYTAGIIYDEKIVAGDPRRQDGKTANFAIVYGAREGKLIEAGLAADWNEARALLDQLLVAFPEEMDFIADWRRRLRIERVAKTRLGRWRSFGEYVPLDVVEREGFNLIIQGTGAELVFEGMAAARSVWEKYGAKLVLQVHDEVVIEIEERAAEPLWLPQFKQELITALETTTFSLPMKVEVKSGPRWG